MKRFRSGLIAASLVLVGLFGIAATPAQAATTVQASLHIFLDPEAGKYVMRSLARIPMPRSEGIDQLNDGARIEFRFYGDDATTDTLLLAPQIVAKGSYALVAATDAIYAESRHVMTYAELNEDPGILDVDEIYVNVRFIDSEGVTVEVDSALVVGFF